MSTSSFSGHLFTIATRTSGRVINPLIVLVHLSTSRIPSTSAALTVSGGSRHSECPLVAAYHGAHPAIEEL